MRLSRAESQGLDYARHTESRLRNQLFPFLGRKKYLSITETVVYEWINDRRNANVANTSLRTYFDLLNNISNAAVKDKVIDHNPCDGVKVGAILRGMSRAPKWVPNDDQVLALLDVVPDEYQAAIWLGAGEGMRLGEVLGTETGPRCVDPANNEVHVVQQLKFHKERYGGFYVAPPKAGSSGDVDLDDHVAQVVTAHIDKYPLVAVELADVTYGPPDPGKPPLRRTVELLFPDEQGRPMHDQYWAKMWTGWRDAAGWPEGGTFHSLRHYFATTLITNGVDPTDVQRALRHASLRITLDTYVHWWPRAERRRNVVGTVLGALTTGRRYRPNHG